MLSLQSPLSYCLLKPEKRDALLSCPGFRPHSHHDMMSQSGRAKNRLRLESFLLRTAQVDAGVEIGPSFYSNKTARSFDCFAENAYQDCQEIIKVCQHI